MAGSTDQRLVADLDADLAVVLRRGLHNIDINRGSQKRVAFAQLEDVAYEYSGAPRSAARIGVISELLRAAIDTMTDPAGQTRMVVRLGLVDGALTTSPYELGDRARRILGEGNSESARRQVRTRSAVARRELAACIAELIGRRRDDRLLNRPIVTVADLLQGQPQYVRRDALHEQIDAQTSRRRLVVLAGERGTGKSRLALEYVAERIHSDDDFLYINGESGLTAARDVSAILAARGTATREASLERLAIALSGILAAVDAPRWLVIDNVEDEVVLHSLLPRATRSTVLITTSVALPSYRSLEIVVAALEEPESVRLVTALLSQVSEAEAVVVSNLLGRRPLPIVQMCGFVLADEAISVPDILSEMVHSPAAVLDAPRPLVDRTLTVLYERTLDSIRREPGGAIAIDVLTAIALSGPAPVPRAMLAAVVRQGSVREAAESAAHRAVLQLERRYLINRVGSHVSCHPLSHLLLRDLVSNSASTVCVRMFRFLAGEIADTADADPLPNSVVALAPHVLSVAIELLDREAEESGIGKVEVDAFLSIGIRAAIQSGSKLTAALHDLLPGRLANYPRSVRLWIRLQAESFSFQWGAHAQTVESVLSRSAKDATWTTALDFADFLYYIEALVEEGKCTQALDVITREEERLFAERGGVHPGPPSAQQYGEYLILLGRIGLALGMLDLAMDHLRKADAWLRQEGGSSHWAIAGRMKALMHLVDVALIRGMPSHYIGEIQAVANDVAQVGKGMVDLSTSARYAQISGRGLAHLLLHLAHTRLEKEDPTWAPVDDIEELLSTCLDNLTVAADLYRRASMRLRSDDITVDKLIIEVLYGRRSLGEVSDFVMSDGALVSSEARMRAGRLIIKVMLIANQRSFDSYSQIVIDHDTYAYTFAAKRESIYLYSEHLLLAVIFAALRNEPAQDSRLAALRDAFEMLDRQDKWERMQQCLSDIAAAPHKFRQSFSYFLNW